MPNFDVQIRHDYTDMTGLVLDLRSADLASIEGAHDGSDDVAVLSDASKSWAIDSLVGKVVRNITDGSYGVITANTASTVTATLTGGTDDDWDTGDEYSIQGDNFGVLKWPNAAPAARVYRSEYSGEHDGSDNQATLSDSSSPWEGMNLAGMVVYNVTDGSLGWITANTATTVTATLSGGTDNDWDNGDVYLIADPQFGDAYNSVVAEQPIVRTVSGYRLLEFVRAKDTVLYVPLINAFPPTWWTVALEFWKGASTGNWQYIFDGDADQDLLVIRRNSSGNHAIKHGNVYISGSSDHPDGAGVMTGVPDDTDANYYVNGPEVLNGAGLAEPIPAGTDASWIGASRIAGGVHFLDGRIRTLKVWDRPMSPLEVDFLFQSLPTDGTDYSVQSRATVELRVWTDDVNSVNERYSRITNQTAAPRRFLLAMVDGVARFQIAAAVAGKVRRDSELGGDLFALAWIETPAGQPFVCQDAGWSAVFDVCLNSNYPGHYSCAISRDGGGSVIVHFDVEAA